MKKLFLLMFAVLIGSAFSFLFLGTQAVADQDPKELVFVFQKQKNPQDLKAAADKVAKELTKSLGMKVSVSVPTDYSASIQALVSKKADFAYTSSLPFLLARRDGGASILLAEERVDAAGKARTEYDAVFVVRKDSPLQTLDDLIAQANQRSFVFTSPTSTSGYLFAYAEFVRRGLLTAKQDPKSVFKAVSFGGGYTQALEQVVRKDADVAAVSYYTVEGDQAETYLPKEQLQQLRILGRVPGVPTHVITARSGLSDALKQRVSAALLQLAKEHGDLLTDVYGTATFVTVDEDKHVAKTIEAVEFLGLPIENLAK